MIRTCAPDGTFAVVCVVNMMGMGGVEGMLTFLELAHMLDATEHHGIWVAGWVGEMFMVHTCE